MPSGSRGMQANQGFGVPAQSPLIKERPATVLIEVRLRKHILVVAHYPALKIARVEMLNKAGYEVEPVESDDAAMTILEKKHFDLVLIGRRSELAQKGLDQRLRERYPHLLILKIESSGPGISVYPSQIIDSQPKHLIQALEHLLGNALSLAPTQMLNDTGPDEA